MKFSRLNEWYFKIQLIYGNKAFVIFDFEIRGMLEDKILSILLMKKLRARDILILQ